jgi:hypothetical protein
MVNVDSNPLPAQKSRVRRHCCIIPNTTLRTHTSVGIVPPNIDPLILKDSSMLQDVSCWREAMYSQRMLTYNSG